MVLLQWRFFLLDIWVKREGEKLTSAHLVSRLALGLGGMLNGPSSFSCKKQEENWVYVQVRSGYLG